MGKIEYFPGKDDKLTLSERIAHIDPAVVHVLEGQGLLVTSDTREAMRRAHAARTTPPRVDTLTQLDELERTHPRPGDFVRWMRDEGHL